MQKLTQMGAARQGVVTPQMKDVLAAEVIDPDQLLAGLAGGRIVIPANHRHTALRGVGIGAGLRTKINVNLGVSGDCCQPEMEMRKVEQAIALKADAIMDLSTVGDGAFRRRLAAASPLMIGTVPIYDVLRDSRRSLSAIGVEDFFDAVIRHAEDGVDFMTLHAGLTRTAVERLCKNERLTCVVSRGGSIILDWMTTNDRENPFYENFDRLLEICRRYDITLSLGDGLRPGCLKDATDAAQIQELIILGELTKAAWEQEVQVLIEGPGHVPINEISTNVQLQKKLCHAAPFYVLGPLVTDVAPGYDHITAAIGGALAAAAGADFLC